MIWPASGRYSPARMLMSVVLPAPFSPSSAWTSPQRARKWTAVFATTPGKALSIPVISTAKALSVMRTCSAGYSLFTWRLDIVHPFAAARSALHSGGRRGKERAASFKKLAEQRLAAGGSQSSPDPELVREKLALRNIADDVA